jgi:hypothetical protein
MSQLTKIYRIRLSESDIEKIQTLKANSIKPGKFIRKAINEYFKSEFPELLAEITKKEKIKYPF